MVKVGNGPDFLGIGAQKAGTTWLHAQLAAHPDVWVPPPKELHFFDRGREYPSPHDLSEESFFQRIVGEESWEGPRTLAGLQRVAELWKSGDRKQARWWWRFLTGKYDEAWYRRLFPTDGFAAVGEITPEYAILSMEDIRRVRDVNPGMRLILLLRDPVERSWSSIRYNHQEGFNSVNIESIDEVLAEARSPRLMRRCDYTGMISRYLECFPASQLCVGFFDAISEQPEVILREILDFLGVDAGELPEAELRKSFNPSREREMPVELRDALNDMYRPMVGKLAEAVGGYASRWLARMDGEIVDRGNAAATVIFDGKPDWGPE